MSSGLSRQADLVRQISSDRFPQTDFIKRISSSGFLQADFCWADRAGPISPGGSLPDESRRTIPLKSPQGTFLVIVLDRHATA